METETLLLFIVFISGLYMALNIGANDVANAVGTAIGSSAITLRQAVIIAAIFEFAGAFFFGSHVTETVQKGVVDPAIFTSDPRLFVYGMLSALIAAGSWLQIASTFGWPVSTTHSIVGALIGFGIVASGVDAIHWGKVGIILSSWLTSPLIACVLSFGIFSLIRSQIFYKREPIRAAKRWIPLLVFVFVSTLSLLVLYKGLRSVALPLNFFETTLLSFGIGVAGALISGLLLLRVKNSTEEVVEKRYIDPEIPLRLTKAKKHLSKIEDDGGEARYRLEAVTKEIEDLQRHYTQKLEHSPTHTEYSTVEGMFAILQLLSVSTMAFAHGANDVANAIGPMSAAIDVLKSGSLALQTTIPSWTLALGGAGIILGLALWGWKVIDTIGKKITELTPTRGFSAEFGAALTILFASRIGMPISTTHTLVGAVIGVGLARGIEALNLGMMKEIALSWLVTVPAGAFIASVIFWILQSTFG